jgi:hypothetical protein
MLRSRDVLNSISSKNRLRKLYSCFGETSGSHDGEYEDAAFWDVATCGPVETDRCFWGAYCLQDDSEAC